MLDSKTRKGIECCLKIDDNGCYNCPYDKDETGFTLTASECKRKLYDDLIAYIDDCENVIKLSEETT